MATPGGKNATKPQQGREQLLSQHPVLCALLRVISGLFSAVSQQRGQQQNCLCTSLLIHDKLWAESASLSRLGFLTSEIRMKPCQAEEGWGRAGSHKHSLLMHQHFWGLEMSLLPPLCKMGVT